MKEELPCDDCRDGVWHKECRVLKEFLVSAGDWKNVVGSNGTVEEKPIRDYFLFIICWALGSLLFLTILFYGGYLIVKYLLN